LQNKQAMRMNIIHQLYDEQFIAGYLKKRILPLYPDFKRIKKIQTHGIKNNIWERTYHVVVGYETWFETRAGKTKRLQLYCSAHSNEQRKNVYDALKFLWSRSFSRGNLTIPHPLFYSQRFKGIFYRGIKGNNLYHYIREKDIGEVQKITRLAALWFAKLHKLDTRGARNFNRKNSLIETTVPGAKHWLRSIAEREPQFYDEAKQIFEHLNAAEKKFLRSTPRRWLIHGDAHPENVVKISEKKIGVIDFTDMCLGDFARDIGSFLQQLDYMMRRHIPKKILVTEMKKLFLETYLAARNLTLDEDLKGRIQTYYHWTALRTVIFFLVKEHPEPERAQELIDDIKKDREM